MFPTMAASVSLAYNLPELSPNCSNASQELSGCLNLSQEALVGIFNGTIIYWNDPLIVMYNEALRDVNRTITVVVRADGSGTTQIFSGALGRFSPMWKTTYSRFSDGCKNGQPVKWNASLTIRCGNAGRGVAAIIMENKYSIGYLGTSDARDSNLMEARLQNKDGYLIYPNLRNVQSALDASPSFSARLTSDLNNLPGDLTYPIAGFTYFVIRKTTMRNCTVAMELYRMLDYLLSDPLAQTVARDLLKVPLNDNAFNQVKQQALNQMICQGQSVKEMTEYAISVENGSRDAWKLPTAIVIVLVMVVVLIVLSMLGYSKYQKHKSALTNSFILSNNQIEAQMKPVGSVTSTKTKQSGPSSTMIDWMATGFEGEIIQQIIGDNLLLTPLCAHLNPEELTWQAKIALVRFRDEIAQGNLVKFIGICERKERWNVVSICPTKGRLTDILRTTKFNLDNIFRNSIINDIAKGMAHLHQKNIIHGQLTTSCCYIDARWNVVIGDWEQLSLHKAQKIEFYAFERVHSALQDEQNQEISQYDYYKLLFWTAPEALVWIAGVYAAGGMQKSADVYSYGVVVYETFAGCEPYESVLKALSEDLYKSPQMLLKQIKSEQLRPAYYNELAMKFDEIGALIWSTWDTTPHNRPTFSEILKQLKMANPKQKSILDTMMVAVERYAFNLEEKVMERTRDLEKTTKSLESLLNNMLPAALAAKLASGELVEPEYFESATVFFSDIVGFTTFASAHTPFEVVKLLNDLYSAFDAVIIQSSDVYKVETIGDAYMCVSGIPNRNGNKHSAEIANLALSILSTVVTVKISDVLSEPLKVRIGINSGPVIAGIVGLKMPRYCLFGDTVNTASRMESSSLPLRIQLSEATKVLLEEFNIYRVVERGLRDVKGKGAMLTYWLISSDEFSGVLPDYDATEDEQLFSLLDIGQVK
ncbi:guanylate cyclase 2G-like [Paramacrobiotus metropolitanus]|uniref:guanylate cyclase 2G-like n=1 Tax=Paramacrobiotus metropolitanus TaxID=2943436 RepID=UPI002445C773|nr:guanylate cyclase 2G-like [Paramacrobiotus metropolitanus]